MTLILARTSARYALMVTDRRVTRDGAEYDPDANKNVLFGDANAVVAVGYTGMAYIGRTPTDQWIAETLTGLAFPEGRRGKGSVPMFMTTDYERRYIGLRIRNLRKRLSEIRPFILRQYRDSWSASLFDVVITGFEWNHGEVRPLLAALSKPAGSDRFELSAPARQWYLPLRGRFPVRMCAAPAQNVSEDELKNVDAQVESASGAGQSSPGDIAEFAGRLLARTIQQVSVRLNVVGADSMSVMIPPPAVPNPTIRVHYIAAGRDRGELVAGEKRAPVPVAFSPWIISPGCIRSPSIFTNVLIESRCGPYEVVMEGPRTDGIPGAISSQQRRQLE